MHVGIILAEEKSTNMWSDKRMRRKAAATLSLSLPSSFVCTKCLRNCHLPLKAQGLARSATVLLLQLSVIFDASPLSSQIDGAMMMMHSTIYIHMHTFMDVLIASVRITQRPSKAMAVDAL